MIAHREPQELLEQERYHGCLRKRDFHTGWRHLGARGMGEAKALATVEVL